VRARGRAVSLLAAILVAGCAPRRSAQLLRPTTAEELLASLATRRSAVTSLRARARVRSRLAGVGSREAVLVQRPAAVRIDVMHPFGLAIALGAQDGLLWAYRPGEGTRYEAPATADNVSRLLGAPVAVADVVDVLLGVPPARRAAGTPSLSTTGGEYRVTLPIVAGVQTLRFAGDTLNLLGAEEVRPDGTVLRVAFGDYRDGFPHAIQVAAPASNGAMELALDAVEPNAAIDPALFAPPPAPRVEPLDAALEPR
jgi:hypothetical protein